MLGWFVVDEGKVRECVLGGVVVDVCCGDLICCLGVRLSWCSFFDEVAEYRCDVDGVRVFGWLNVQVCSC